MRWSIILLCKLKFQILDFWENKNLPWKIRNSKKVYSQLYLNVSNPNPNLKGKFLYAIIQNQS